MTYFDYIPLTGQVVKFGFDQTKVKLTKGLKRANTISTVNKYSKYIDGAIVNLTTSEVDDIEADDLMAEISRCNKNKWREIFDLPYFKDTIIFQSTLTNTQKLDFITTAQNARNAMKAEKERAEGVPEIPAYDPIILTYYKEMLTHKGVSYDTDITYQEAKDLLASSPTLFTERVDL